MGLAVARDQADIVRRMFPSRRFVLFGRKVARAFGLGPEAPWMTWDEGIAVVPHPSGRSYWYNDPENRARARTFLRRVAHEILNWERP